MIDAGERSGQKIRNTIRGMISSINSAKIDYISIVDYDTLKEGNELKGTVLIALAVFIGNTRLIDNLKIDIAG